MLIFCHNKQKSALSIMQRSASETCELQWSSINLAAMKSSKHSKFCLRDVDVSGDVRAPFIVSGYRRPGLTYRECFESLLHPTNETINFLSHAVAFVLFIHRFRELFTNFSGPDEYPLICFAVGICGLMLTSSIAHLFSSVSLKGHHLAFYCDYAAISLYSFAGAQAFFFYCRPLHTNHFLFNSPALFLSGSALISFLTTYCGCVSRHQWKKFNYVIRTCSFTVAFVYNTLPWTYRLATYTDIASTTSPFYFKRHLFLHALGAVLHAAKLPERLVPGRFDFVGQSHHFLHVTSAIAAADGFSAAEIDFEGQRAALERICFPTLLNTIGAFSVVTAGNAFVIWMCYASMSRQHCEENRKDKIK